MEAIERAKQSVSVAKQAAKRRTQAERSATTRANVIDAAALCVSENGFNNTTTAHIARRAGVTWGAIQHQFGDKDAIFFAVIERSLDELGEIVRDAVAGTTTLEERVQGLVQGMWKVYQTPVFRAGLEILLGTRSHSNADYRRRTGHFISTLTTLFTDTFKSFGIPEERQIQAERFALATLAGFALEETFAGRAGNFDGQLATLTTTVTSILNDG